MTEKEQLDINKIGDLFVRNELIRLYEENEQLKNEVYDWKASAEDYLKLGQSLKKENEQLKKEILDLRAEIGRLNNKKEIEQPHWLKYKVSKGYTTKVNQDIRFGDDVE